MDTRPSLLIRLRNGADEDAWRAFLECYGPMVLSYCRRRGLQEADAADVAQETLTQVVASIRSFEYRPDRGRFRSWLATIVRSKIANFEERARRRERASGGSQANAVGLAISESDTDDAWEEAFTRHVLETAIARIRPNFDPRNWAAFEAVWLADRPVEEVAESLGISASAVYVAKSRILKRLREVVIDLTEDLPIDPR